MYNMIPRIDLALLLWKKMNQPLAIMTYCRKAFCILRFHVVCPVSFEGCAYHSIDNVFFDFPGLEIEE